MDQRLQDIVAATGELPALPSTTARLLACWTMRRSASAPCWTSSATILP